MTEHGTLFVYSGPSGVGKGTLLAPLMQQENIRFSISMTTRAPRPGEINGREYYFVTREAFEQQLAQNGLLEHASYNGNYYGTPRKMVEDQLAQGFDVLLEIEVNGAAQVRAAFPDSVSIFILPPAFDELRQRLTTRATEPPEVVERRLCEAKSELTHARDYDYIIVNAELKQAREQLHAVFIAAKCQKRFMEKLIDKVCAFV